MRTPAGRSLVFGLVCACAGLLGGGIVAGYSTGEGWEWFFVPTTLAAFGTGAAFWRVLPERMPHRRLVWGTLAGALAGMVSHYFAWYLQLLGFNICYWLTGGCVSSLGEPPIDLLNGLWGTFIFSLVSLMFLGWATMPLGMLVGAIWAWRRL